MKLKIFNKYIFDNENQNKYFSDSWSIIHITGSFVFSYLLKKITNLPKKKIFIISLFITIIFEYLENNKLLLNAFNSKYPEYKGDESVNIFGDIIFNLIGIFIILKINNNKYFTLIFIILELIPFIISRETFLYGILLFTHAFIVVIKNI